MEKRKFSRVPFRTLASIHQVEGALFLEGEVKNLSLNGMLLDSDNSMPVGTEIKIEIFLVGSDPEIEIKLNGEIIRVTEEGTAIKFNLKHISLEALTHLKYVVSYNLGDGDTVMEEYFEHLDNDS